MNDRERVEKAITAIEEFDEEFDILDKRVTFEEISHLMSYRTLNELAHSFAMFINLIYDLRNILERRNEEETG